MALTMMQLAQVGVAQGLDELVEERGGPMRDEGRDVMRAFVAAVEAAGLPARPLLAGDDTRLDDAARRPPPGGQVPC